MNFSNKFGICASKSASSPSAKPSGCERTNLSPFYTRTPIRDFFNYLDILILLLSSR